ncbi:MAG: hypothetical protein ACOYI8_05535 [Christensenellales bacterium]|jgi:hypothetical protein
MKKLLIACAAMLLLLLPAGAMCEDEDDVLRVETLAARNDIETVLSRVGSLSVNAVYYDGEGAESLALSSYAYRVGGELRIAYEDSAGNVRALGSGEGCGIDGATGKPYVVAFIDGAFEEMFSEMRHSLLVNIDGNETISRFEEVDDTTVLIVTEEPVAGRGHGYTEGTLVTEHLLEKDTLILKSLTESLRTEDGAEKILCRAEVVRGARFKFPDSLKALAEPNLPTRAIYIVVYAGTEGEKTLLAEYPECAYLEVAVRDGYGVFADAEGTLPASLAAIASDEDSVVYVIAAK